MTDDRETAAGARGTFAFAAMVRKGLPGGAEFRLVTGDIDAADTKDAERCLARLIAEDWPGYEVKLSRVWRVGDGA